MRVRETDKGLEWQSEYHRVFGSKPQPDLGTVGRNPLLATDLGLQDTRDPSWHLSLK